MTPDHTGNEAVGDDEFDYTTPEAQRAMRRALSLVLELRDSQTGPLVRKVRLYERTLGLAVIPILVRRAVMAVARRRRIRGMRR